MTINGLVSKISEIKGKEAILEIDGQKLAIKKEFLPANAKEGDEIKLFFLSSEESSAQEKKLAKYILEEILNGK